LRLRINKFLGHYVTYRRVHHNEEQKSPGNGVTNKNGETVWTYASDESKFFEYKRILNIF